MPKKKKPDTTYSISIIPDDGSETKGFVGVSKKRMIVLFSALGVMILVLGMLLVFFTPIKRLMPDYQTKLRFQKNILQNQWMLDSLNREIENLDLYNTRLKSALGITPTIIDSTKLAPEQIASATPRHHYNFAVEKLTVDAIRKLKHKKKPNAANAFVSGTLSQAFSPQTSHYGIDIATASNETIGAIADGTVLFADWTNDYGYTVIIDHSYFISFYKHCNTALVREGERVKKGEVLALTGNRGNESSGPHLHLEVWKDGVPVNPSQYININ